MGNPYRNKNGEPFAPKNFSAVQRSGNRKVASNERVWNDKGEFNASNKKEAFQMIQGLLNGLADGTYQPEKTASETWMDSPENDSILREAFSDQNSEGFSMVGQQMVNVIKEVIDYEGIARKVFAPRTVKAGEVIRYDRDAFVQAWVIAQDGQTPESVVENRVFYPPEFEVTSYGMIEIADHFRAQYDIVARIQDRSKQAIMYQEDVALMNLLQASGATVNTTTFFATLNVAALESMRYQIERHRLICDKFVINRQEASDFINTITGQVDPVTQRELFMAGYIGNFLNAQIITTAGTNTFEILDPGEVVAVTAPEFLGGMPVRVELFSEPTNQAVDGKPRKGWYFYELISQYLGNAAGVSLGSRL
jgi:hypothetical protein